MRDTGSMGHKQGTASGMVQKRESAEICRTLGNSLEHVWSKIKGAFFLRNSNVFIYCVFSCYFT